MRGLLHSLLGLMVAAAALSAHAATLDSTNRLEIVTPNPPQDPSWLNELRITVPGRDTGSITEKSPRIFSAPPVEMGTNRLVSAEGDADIPFSKSIYGAEAAEHMLRAQSLLSSNMTFQASKELWMASRLKPELEDPVSGLAMCFLIAEDYWNAGALLERVVKTYPNSVDARFNLASAYHGQKRHKEAIAYLESVLERYPEPGKVHYNMGINFLAQDDRDSALVHLSKSAALQPRNPFPLLAMARIQARAGNRDTMFTILNEANVLLRDEERNTYLLDPAFASFQRDPEFLSLFTSVEALPPSEERPLYLTPLAPLPFPR